MAESELVREIKAMNEQRAVSGRLIYITCSFYDWFSGAAPRCFLLILFDNETGRLNCLEFTLWVNIYFYFHAVTEYIERHGKPKVFATDGGEELHDENISVTAEESLARLGRAMKALGIEYIDDSSTETKLRVEQVVVTLQKDLVRELRSRKIFTIDEANRFVPEFIANFNSQLGIDESQLHDEHRPLLSEEDPIEACLLA
jgi:hypothetical protein